MTVAPDLQVRPAVSAKSAPAFRRVPGDTYLQAHLQLLAEPLGTRPVPEGGQRHRASDPAWDVRRHAPASRLTGTRRLRRHTGRRLPRERCAGANRRSTREPGPQRNHNRHSVWGIGPCPAAVVGLLHHLRRTHARCAWSHQGRVAR